MPEGHSRSLNMKKVTSPILLHLLRQELRFPRSFLWGCILRLGAFKKRIDARFPKELVELMALPLLVYITLKEKIGERKAFEIMRVAVLATGITKQNFLFDTAERDRTFENFVELELENNRTGVTKWNALEIVERTPSRFEIKITRCLYHELATSLEIPEFTPIVCQVDNAFFNSYLPDRLIFDRGGVNQRIADGNRECRFIWEVR